MAKHGKKYRKSAEQIAAKQIITVKDALAKVKDLAFAKFNESVDVDVVLGIDPIRKNASNYEYKRSHPKEDNSFKMSPKTLQENAEIDLLRVFNMFTGSIHEHHPD